MHTKKKEYLEEDMVELTAGCSELVQKNIKLKELNENEEKQLHMQGLMDRIISEYENFFGE